MRLPLGWLREYVAFEVEPRRLADELTLHAQTEEQVLYPAAILVGDLVRARSK